VSLNLVVLPTPEGLSHRHCRDFGYSLDANLARSRERRRVGIPAQPLPASLQHSGFHAAPQLGYAQDVYGTGSK
jgi:hypothetical protein